MSTVDPWVYNNTYRGSNFTYWNNTPDHVSGDGPIIGVSDNTNNVFYRVQSIPIYSGNNLRMTFTPSLDYQAEGQEETMARRRIVKRYVIDTTEEIVADGIPIDAFIVYEDEGEFLTDADDTELERDLDLKGILVRQNERRATLLDEEASKEAKTPIYLKPIRQRDLKVLVRTMFSFPV